MEKQSLNKTKWAAFRPVLFDVVVPPAAYFILHFLGLNDIVALTAAGIISGINAAIDLVRQRKLSSLSVMVFLLFALSIVLMLLIKDPRIILLKPAIFIEVGGMYCLVTTFKRPLILDGVEPMATDGDPVKIARWRQAWTDNAVFKKRIRFANVLVSIAVMLEGVSRAVVALNFSLKSAVILSNLPLIALVAFFALLGRFYMKPTAAIAFKNNQL